MSINGNDLIAWGFTPDKWFKDGIDLANKMRSNGSDDHQIIIALTDIVPVPEPEIPLRTNGKPFNVMLDAVTDDEKANFNGVYRHMDELMRVPTIVRGAVMPDACPAGTAPGTIPVGGVVATENAIHPGFHSADICCSVALTLFKREDDPRKVLDAVGKVTHFGPGGRKRSAGVWKKIPDGFEAAFDNPFLSGLEEYARNHFGTQGDGNHFAYVGRLKSTGQIALVTHHGSRGFGAQLYKRGMAVAKKHTGIVAPRIPSHNAWIAADSREGEQYWDALQWIRLWTKYNHYAIHDLVASKIGNAVADRFWNEHNFVFQKSDGLFYHGKGATPSWKGFSEDDDGRTLIPLNMAEPILIAGHRDNPDALGFSPHGAGRNMSRTQYLQRGQLELPKDIDARFFCGKIDASELPGAYKNATAVREQIAKYDLATVTDLIEPYGCYMAGDWEGEAPWRKKKEAKKGRLNQKQILALANEEDDDS
jgi:RNA-splicing ligase RtcB